MNKNQQENRKSQPAALVSRLHSQWDICLWGRQKARDLNARERERKRERDHFWKLLPTKTKTKRYPSLHSQTILATSVFIIFVSMKSISEQHPSLGFIHLLTCLVVCHSHSIRRLTAASREQWVMTRRTSQGAAIISLLTALRKWTWKRAVTFVAERSILPWPNHFIYFRKRVKDVLRLASYTPIAALQYVRIVIQDCKDRGL